MSVPSTGPSDHERRGGGESVEPLVVSPKVASRMLSCGLTRFYEILPELDSYLDGKVRRITTASIRRRVAHKLAEAQGQRETAVAKTSTT